MAHNGTGFIGQNGLLPEAIRFASGAPLSRVDRLPETGVAEEHDRSKVASITYAWRKSMGTVP